MPETAPRPARDRSFGPTVLVGLVGSGLLALAGHRDWLSLDVDPAQEGAASIFLDASPGIAQEPVAGAAGLVALAAWGVLLVTRGRWRRAAAALGVLASIGGLAAWVTGLTSLEDGLRERADDFGLAGAFDVSWTPWVWLSALGAVLALAASVVALVRVSRWPAMGSRYDAPTAAAGTDQAAVGASSAAGEDLTRADPADLWKSLDEGHDPT